jgi:hypothetical protein
MEIVKMHVETLHVERMPFVYLSCILLFVSACPILMVIRKLHATHVRGYNNVDLLFSVHNKLHDFTARPVTEPAVAVGCSDNDECPDYAACINRVCINPCAEHNPCAPLAECRVIRHRVVCTCPDGLIGNPETSCRPRE